MQHPTQSPTAVSTDGADVLSRLKEETREWHNRIEGQVGVMDPNLDLERYKHLLSTFYGFYQPLEAQALKMDACQSFPENFQLQNRLKSSLLESDLTALKVHPKTLPKATKLPLLETPEHLLGCFYVMEGATLGGQFITQHIQQRLGLATGSGCSFFNSYGEQVPAMWQAYRGILTEAGQDKAAADTICAKADETFKCLSQWFDETSHS